MAISRTSGASTTLTITAGASGATLTGLQLRAQLVSTDGSTIISNTNTSEAQVSKNEHGVQAPPFSTRAEIDPDDAQDLVNARVSAYQNGRPIVRITVPNMNDASLLAALSTDIGHRIRVIEGNTSLDDEFWVIRMEHRIRAGLHETSIWAQEANTIGLPLIWDTGKWDENTWG